MCHIGYMKTVSISRAGLADEENLMRSYPEGLCARCGGRRRAGRGVEIEVVSLS